MAISTSSNVKFTNEVYKGWCPIDRQNSDLILAPITIIFSNNDNGLSSTVIKTQNLFMRTIRDDDPFEVANYVRLFGDSEAMEKYADGVPRAREQTENRIKKIWTVRKAAGIPFIPLTVYRPTNGSHDENKLQFLGFVVVGYGEVQKTSEIAYLFFSKFWRHKVATEAILAAIYGFAALTILKGIPINGAPFEAIVATSRKDNLGSIKILEDKLRMKIQKVEESKGFLRNHYLLDKQDFMQKSILSSEDKYFNIFLLGANLNKTESNETETSET